MARRTLVEHLKKFQRTFKTDDGREFTLQLKGDFEGFHDETEARPAATHPDFYQPAPPKKVEGDK